jgi:hypothetical protein
MRHGHEDELLRRKLNRRAEKANPPGTVRESGFSLQVAGAEPLGLRENSRFSDQTDLSLIGWAYIDGMLT